MKPETIEDDKVPMSDVQIASQYEVMNEAIKKPLATLSSQWPQLAPSVEVDSEYSTQMTHLLSSDPQIDHGQSPNNKSQSDPLHDQFYLI